MAQKGLVSPPPVLGYESKTGGVHSFRREATSSGWLPPLTWNAGETPGLSKIALSEIGSAAVLTC